MKFAIGFSVTGDKIDVNFYRSALESMGFKNISVDESNFFKSKFDGALFEDEHTISIHETINKIKFFRMLDFFWPHATCQTMGMLGHPDYGPGILPAIALECESDDAIVTFYVCPIPEGEPREPIEGWCERYYTRATAVISNWCDTHKDFYRLLQHTKED